MKISTVIALVAISLSFTSAEAKHKLAVEIPVPNELTDASKVLSEILFDLDGNYIKKPDTNKLVSDAAKGMLEGLDPHSAYLSPEDYKEMKGQLSGDIGGVVGIVFAMDENKNMMVVSTMDDSPARKAGILTNDVLKKVDDQSVEGAAFHDIVVKVRGPANTNVKLTFSREGKPFDVDLVREDIPIPDVDYHAEDDVGYIKILDFGEKSTDDLRLAIADLQKQIGPKLKGYVIDLRNNPGGLLNQAVAISDVFLDSGRIVSMKNRDDFEVSFDAYPEDWTSGKKLIVLINGGTASASEIVAGALQDNKRAMIIGTHSYGKGSVQMIKTLSNGGALRFTTQLYYTPSGKSIQEQGIVPDQVVEEDLPPEMVGQVEPVGENLLPNHIANPSVKVTQDKGSSSWVNPDEAADNQLQTALFILRKDTK